MGNFLFLCWMGFLAATVAALVYVNHALGQRYWAASFVFAFVVCVVVFALQVAGARP